MTMLDFFIYRITQPPHFAFYFEKLAHQFFRDFVAGFTSGNPALSPTNKLKREQPKQCTFSDQTTCVRAVLHA